MTSCPIDYNSYQVAQDTRRGGDASFSVFARTAIAAENIAEYKNSTASHHAKSSAASLPKIVIITFAVSIFFALLGFMSLVLFLSKDIIFIHPYISVISFLGGSFLFSSSLLAVKGK